jgi:hypothetical protein
VPGKIAKLLAGTLLDLSAVIALLAPLIAALTLALPLLVKPLRSPRWQQFGSLVIALPLGFALYVLTVTAQEVKSERGAFPTVFDLAEGGSNASFVRGAIGFLRYDRVWVPCVVGLTMTALFLFLALRNSKRDLLPWKNWGLGVLAGLAFGTLSVTAVARAGASIDRFSAAALGNPLSGLLESGVDMLRHRGPTSPRELVLSAQLPPDAGGVSAARLGWPPAHGGCLPHPHARPLDTAKEPPIPDPRGRALVAAFERISAALFPPDDPAVAVFQLSLEGFRADDIQALNARAAPQIAPFTNALYQRGTTGTLTSSKMFQAGARTAHCLGAMTCGLGTLPYNLSFIRDLQPFPVRCVSDVLEDAGVRHSFFYGSDGTFDEMQQFLQAHGYKHVVTQAELPATLPKGAWGGVTDFALFDQATEQVAAALEKDRTPQFALVMSLSNHSPFTTPQDLPQSVQDRVAQALETTVNRAKSDDRLRLLTHSYTDAAVERLFARLEALHLSERSIVMLMADHSTGHDYVWGVKDPQRDAAKSQIPFVIVIPPAFVARAHDKTALAAALSEAARLLDAAPLSQNDVPALLLALMKSHPSVKALPEAARWHTLGGQVTSPYFRPGGDHSSYILGINGVSELYSLDRNGALVGSYEDSSFLKTRADRYRVTPRLIPVTSTLIETMRCAK